MNPRLYPRSLSAAALTATLFALGCGGNALIPDTLVDQPGGSFGTVQGTVYGGHAPLVGAHVYLLQTGSGAIGAQGTSILGTGSTSSPGGYTLHSNPAIGGDPHIPANWKYIITDSTGSFNLTNGYVCTAGTPVYIYAYGGAPTLNAPPGAFNPSIVNLATLGLCPGSANFKGSLSYIYLNEVSTVATAYAFQGFTSPVFNDATHIGYFGLLSASEGLAGIQNAAANTLQLYDIQGAVLGHNANFRTYNVTTSVANTGLGIVPQATLNTLADILAACVDSSNTASPPSSGSNCNLLFAVATGDGTTTNTASGNIPTDTATAAINIARHPAGVGNTSYASTLFNIFNPTGAPFSPVLATAPPDFTVGIQYPQSANAVFTGPESIETDFKGNFYFTTQLTAPNLTASTPTYGTGYFAEGSPMGMILHSNLTPGYTPGGVTIDSSENAWAGTLVGVQGPIFEEGPTTGGVFTSYNPGFTRPDAPVADNSTNSGDLYMVHGPTCPTPNISGCGGSQSNPTLTEVLPNGTNTGSSLLTSYFTPGAYITHAAIDGAGYIWMTSDSVWTPAVGSPPTYGSTIVRVNKSNGTVPFASGFPIFSSGSACGSGIYLPEQPAIDALGNAWIPVYGKNGLNNDVVIVNPSGTICNFATTGNGPYGAAVDGVSNVWITNRTDGTLTGLNYLTGAALTSTNLQPQNQGTNLLVDPTSLAIDISGNAFITNFGGNSIVEIIGMTTPKFGPLGVAAGTLVVGIPQIGKTP